MQQMLESYDVNLKPEDFDLLAARTEGWAAGVRLSAMRWRRGERKGQGRIPRPSPSPTRAGSGSIGEYLVDEYCAGWPNNTGVLWVEVSFLGRQRAAGTDAVTGIAGSGTCGRAGAGEILRHPAGCRARRSASPRPASPGQILRYLLRRPAPRVLPQLQRRAAAGFEAAGDLKNALGTGRFRRLTGRTWPPCWPGVPSCMRRAPGGSCPGRPAWSCCRCAFPAGRPRCYQPSWLSPIRRWSRSSPARRGRAGA